MKTSAYVFVLLTVISVAACKLRPDATATLQDTTATIVAPWNDTSYQQFGARADCSEKALDRDEFISLAKSIPESTVDRQQAVLDRLSEMGAMQTFTINFDSDSAQSPGISKKYPGVIRMREDGTLIIRYTCDRAKSIYGTFEVISYNKTENRFVFDAIEMKEQSPEQRVENNPDLCYGCHDYAGDQTKPDLRPNWNMYPDWKGVFGSHDDIFPLGLARETTEVAHGTGWLPPNKSQEKDEFDQFLLTKVNTAAPDPCYATLPWLRSTSGQAVPDQFAHWPYGVKNGSARKRVYATRPNLKFTEVLSKLQARRNYRRLSEMPGFDAFAPLLALEAAACTERSLVYQGEGTPYMKQSELDDLIKQAVPNYERPAGDDATVVDLRGRKMLHHDPRHPDSRAQALFGIWTALGLTPAEWTLTPFEDSDPAYETGAGPGDNRFFPGDLPMTAYTQHEILDAVVKQTGNTSLASTFSRAAAESADFGAHFQCIDDIAGPTVIATEADRKTLCEGLINYVSSIPRSIDGLGGDSRGLPRGDSRDLPRGIGTRPRVEKFDPKTESIETYLKRINRSLHQRGAFSYGEG